MQGQVRELVSKIRKQWPIDKTEYIAGEAVDVLDNIIKAIDALLKAIRSALTDRAVQLSGPLFDTAKRIQAELSDLLTERVNKWMLQIREQVKHLPVSQRMAHPIRLPLEFRSDMTYALDRVVSGWSDLNGLYDVVPWWLDNVVARALLGFFVRVYEVIVKFGEIALPVVKGIGKLLLIAGGILGGVWVVSKAVKIRKGASD